MNRDDLPSTGINYFDIGLRRTDTPLLHCHDFHELFFNYEHGGEQLTAERRLAMRQDDLYFFPAGQSHIGNGDCHGGVLYLGVEAFSPFAAGDKEAVAVLRWLTGAAERGRNLVPLSPDGRLAMRALFRQFLEEFRRDGRGTYLAWRILTMQMLLTILRDRNMVQEELLLPRLNSAERIHHVCRYLRENCCRAITVDMAARTAGMSRSHFLGRFRQVTGCTFTEYLNRRRCERAMVMLREREATPATVAAACGFSSTSNFYRAFRTLTGQRPGDFRSEA